MNRTFWQVFGSSLLLVLVITIGAIRLVHRTTLNRELVARIDDREWQGWHSR